jgi:hypothetical protein
MSDVRRPFRLGVGASIVPRLTASLPMFDIHHRGRVTKGLPCDYRPSNYFCTREGKAELITPQYRNEFLTN